MRPTRRLLARSHSRTVRPLPLARRVRLPGGGGTAASACTDPVRLSSGGPAGWPVAGSHRTMRPPPLASMVSPSGSGTTASAVIQSGWVSAAPRPTGLCFRHLDDHRHCRVRDHLKVDPSADCPLAADWIIGLHACVQVSSSTSAVRSPPVSPVLMTVPGSNSSTAVSVSARGQCSTPRGTTKSSRGPSTTVRSRI
jgi:hypothetical protein